MGRANTFPRVQPVPQPGHGLTGYGKLATTSLLIQPLVYFSVNTTRSAKTLSTSGTLNIASMPGLAPPPCVPEIDVSTFPSIICKSGSFGMSLIVPPIDPEPYSVPCGPRRTSTRFKSNRAGSMTTLPVGVKGGAVNGVSPK